MGCAPPLCVVAWPIGIGNGCVAGVAYAGVVGIYVPLSLPCVKQLGAFLALLPAKLWPKRMAKLQQYNGCGWVFQTFAGRLSQKNATPLWTRP